MADTMMIFSTSGLERSKAQKMRMVYTGRWVVCPDSCNTYLQRNYRCLEPEGQSEKKPNGVEISNNYFYKQICILFCNGKIKHALERKARDLLYWG